MDRYLGIDYGEKRLGIAISDPLGITAQPQPYILNSATMFNDLKCLCDDYDIVAIVLGLPLNRFGEDTDKSKEIRSFSEKLADALNLPVTLQDERYSTKAVTRTLLEADVSRKKRKEVVDSMAASFILQSFLDKK